MSAILPIPNQMAYTTWSEGAYRALVDAVDDIIPQPGSEEEWQEWADQLALIDELDVPYGSNFPTWQAWAERLVQAAFEM